MGPEPLLKARRIGEIVQSDMPPLTKFDGHPNKGAAIFQFGKRICQ